MDPRILLADDHTLIHRAIKLIAETQFGYPEVKTVISCHEVMAELRKGVYTHMIMDIGLADGSALEILPNIHKVYPKLKVMVFSMQPLVVIGDALIQYGVAHYLPKTAPEGDTIEKLKRFFNNEPDEYRAECQKKSESPFASITARELEVLYYVLKGLKTKDIATTLNVQTNTISTFKHRIYTKTGTTNFRQLVALAQQYNIGA